MDTPNLDKSEADAAAVAKTPNRVTLESIKDKIDTTEYLYPELNNTLTICVVTTVHGFSVIGESACIDLANYNKELGDRLAFEKAVAQLWALEAYRVKFEQFILDQQAYAEPDDIGF